MFDLTGMTALVTRTSGSLGRAMLAFSLIFAAVPVDARPDTDTKAIEAMFADYVEGLAEGDLARLSNAFSPEGVFVSVDAAQNGKTTVVSRPFKNVLASWAANPDPTASGRITGVAIRDDFVASIQAELDYGTARYEDNLLLYKLEGRWKIVAKTTYARDRPGNSTPTTDKD